MTRQLPNDNVAIYVSGTGDLPLVASIREVTLARQWP